MFVFLGAMFAPGNRRASVASAQREKLVLDAWAAAPAEPRLSDPSRDTNLADADIHANIRRVTFRYMQCCGQLLQCLVARSCLSRLSVSCRDSSEAGTAVGFALVAFCWISLFVI